MTKRALVCGAGGFIGYHLVEKLKSRGYWVRGVDLKYPEFADSAADDFQILDLRSKKDCEKAFKLANSSGEKFDEVYQLAADMGGMGFISNFECEILSNNTAINLNLIEQAVNSVVKRYFFSSSACVYPNQSVDSAIIDEGAAYPAMPHSEYGWEKLYAERIAVAYGKKYPINIRIGRLHNCYGPMGAWSGGREKAPAALCRKIAEVADGGEIEIWGDGSALRSYTYISDMIEAICLLMDSNLQRPVNIGTTPFVSVNELVYLIARIAAKNITVKSVPGPVGVEAIRSDFSKMHSLGWAPETTLEQGIGLTYSWIKDQLLRMKDKPAQVINS